MTSWRHLSEELDAWAAAGLAATLWWRDDDAVEPSPELARLLALAVARDLPLALAVIPARASQALAEWLEAQPARAALLQHGYAHRSHAADGEKKAELGAQRPANVVLEELARGWGRMTALFGQTWAPILVPPWNRIAERLVPELAGLGFRGLSTLGPRAAAEPAPGLVQVNTHLDIMHWPPPRGFLGEAESLEILVAQLRARRLGEADAAEPTGLLTHHPAHDAPAWAFLETLLDRLAGHPAVRFVEAGEAFARVADPPAQEAECQEIA
ncbi:MAG: polysaccharide deacetylase family protein [Proteobacteria bacterium]|nr:polysaccharide deacetylase family protein [Pseudomonadota bacterium]